MKEVYKHYKVEFGFSDYKDAATTCTAIYARGSTNHVCSFLSRHLFSF